MLKKVWGGMVFVLEGPNMWCRAKLCGRRCAYQREALGGGGPSLYGCQRPLLHHVLRLLVHTHHRLFGYPQQPRDQLIFTLHLFLPDEEASQSLCWCETPTQMIHSRRRGRKRQSWRNAHAVFTVDSAPRGGGGKVAAVCWPSRVQAGLIVGLLNGSSVGFSRCQRTEAMLPLPPPTPWLTPALSTLCPLRLYHGSLQRPSLHLASLQGRWESCRN